MTPSEINVLLELRKIKKTRLADAIGCTSDELTRTISGERRNERIRERIADYLGMPVDELFGPDHAAVAGLRRQLV